MISLRIGVLFLLITYGYCWCTGTTYLNLCGYCVEGDSGLNENHEVDRCMVCGGNSSCVGCDGLVNSNWEKDACGMCLQKGDVKWNECRIISTAYPSIVDRALGDNIVILSLTGAGFTAEDLAQALPKCNVIADEAQKERPKVLETSIEDSALVLKVELSQALGLYHVTCNGIDGKATFRVVNSLGWNTMSIKPERITVDTTYQLEALVRGERVGEGLVWCFLRCAEAPLRVIPGEWKSENRILCQDVTPRLADWCEVGVAASQEATEDKESTGSVVKLPIASPPPSVVSADYNEDLGKLLVRFNANIQLTVDCNAIFSDASKLSLETSRCTVSGNILAVALRREHPVLPMVQIIQKNGIRRMGATDPLLSPECAPITVPVSTHKVLPPNLSLMVPSVLCRPSEELRVASIGEQRLNYLWSVPPPAVPPSTQRENLLLWQSVRQLQKGFNDYPRSSAHLNASELIVNAAYSINVRGINALGDEQSVSSSVRFTPSAPVTVTVLATPAVTSLLAEINVTLCAPLPSGLSFAWFLNGKAVSASGRVVLMANLTPGHYNVSCVVSLYSTSELLATGWVLTQVLPSEERALLSPSEQVVSTIDKVTIQAFTPYNKAGLWRCFTLEDLPCISPGKDHRRIEDIIQNNVTSLKLSPGVLAVGRYVWRLENMPSTEAVVIVRKGIPPLLDVTPVPPLVNPTVDLQVRAEAHRLQPDCTLRWSTVFRIGFNYFNLQEDVGLGDELRIYPGVGTTAELTLVVPTARGVWGGLMAEASYLLRFTVLCPVGEGGSAHVDVPVTVNVPPVVAQLEVFPLSGTALITPFIIGGGAAHDVFHDYPLQFEWAIKDDTDIVTIDIGSSARTITLLLPPGKVKMALQVCDIHTTCSNVISEDLMVASATSVPDDTITFLKKEITELVLEGSTVSGLGKAVVAIKALTTAAADESLTSDQTLILETQLQQLADATDDAIATRSRDLTLGIANDPANAVKSLQFLRLLLHYEKFFKLSRLTLDLIVELKDSATHSNTLRVKRGLQQDVRELPEISIIDEATTALGVEGMSYQNNATHLLNEVKKYMVALCSEKSLFVETKHVVLWVSGKLRASDVAKEFQPTKSSLKVQLRSWRKDSCLAVATLRGNFFKPQDVDLKIFSDVYEVELVVDNSILSRTTSTDPIVNITIPLLDQTSIGDTMKCSMWTAERWLPLDASSYKKKDDVICRTRDFGYFAVVSKSASTTVSTKETLLTVPPSTPVTTEAPTSTKEAAATEGTTSSNNFIYPTILPSSTLMSYGGAQFRVEEDFDKVVAGKEATFQSELAKQIASKLDVKVEDIVIIVEKGSVLVTVYFLVSMEEDQATAVAGRLSRLVQDGQLQLTSDGKTLNIPPQNVSIIQDSDKQALVLFTATFIVMGIVLGLVVLMAFVVLRRAPRSDLMKRRFQAEDSTPKYLSFDNDPTLDGLSVSVGRRRSLTSSVDGWP